MNRPQRFVVGEKLLAAGVDLVHVEHELHRVLKVHKHGLTEKELAHIEKTLEMILAARIRIRTVQGRAQTTCGDWWYD